MALYLIKELTSSDLSLKITSVDLHNTIGNT